jgi:hypothetical protein
MKESFQSKYIQEMLDIKKERVAYLGMKVPIKPEIRQVEGTGRAHKYSYKNLLHFAIVEWLTETGMVMRDIKYLLSVLDNPTEIMKLAPTRRVRVSQRFKGLDVKVVDWPPRDEGGLILRLREEYVAIHKPGKIRRGFENYYSPDSNEDLYFIMGGPADPLGNTYTLAMTNDIATFAQGISHMGGIGQIIIDLKEIKGRVNFYMIQDTWEPVDEEQEREMYEAQQESMLKRHFDHDEKK